MRELDGVDITDGMIDRMVFDGMADWCRHSDTALAIIGPANGYLLGEISLGDTVNIACNIPVVRASIVSEETEDIFG